MFNVEAIAKVRKDPVLRRSLWIQAITDSCKALGMNLDDPELEETPRRVADLFEEFCQDIDLVALLKTGFENPESEGAMVIQTKIPFRGLCAHHLLPFFGYASIGYLPHKRVVGLSKLTRLTQAAGTIKPSTQEAITNAIANALVEGIDPNGVIVVTEAQHTCMSVRGINSPGVITKVSALRGIFLHVSAARQEFLSLISTS